MGEFNIESRAHIRFLQILLPEMINITHNCTFLPKSKELDLVFHASLTGLVLGGYYPNGFKDVVVPEAWLKGLVEAKNIVKLKSICINVRQLPQVSATLWQSERLIHQLRKLMY